MANMYNLNGLSYNPHENPEWFTRAMFGGRLVSGGYIRVLTGIKGDELLSQIDLANKILQADGKDCAWTPNQIIKLSEKTATVKTYKINLEQCIDELENKRTGYMLSPGAMNEELPAELEDATLALIAIGLSNEIEEMIIGGDSSVDPNQFNGLQTILLNSTEATKIVGAVITKSNVVAAVEAVYDAFTEDVLQAEDAGTLYIFTSFATRRKLRSALAEMNNQVLAAMWTFDDTDKRNPRVYYNGVEIVPVKGINANTLIGIDQTNAFLLTDLASDMDDIEMGQFAKPMDNKVWIKGRMRLGFVVPFEDEAVIWSPLVTEAQTAVPYGSDLRLVPNSLVFAQAGESKTFTVITSDPAAAITVNGSGSGFTVTKGATVDGVTTVTVAAGEIVTVPGVDPAPDTEVATSAADITGKRDPRVGQVKVSIDGTDRIAYVTLNQRNDDSEVVTIEP